MTALLYGISGFHKLNADFFPRRSCGAGFVMHYLLQRGVRLKRFKAFEARFVDRERQLFAVRYVLDSLREIQRNVVGLEPISVWMTEAQGEVKRIISSSDKGKREVKRIISSSDKGKHRFREYISIFPLRITSCPFDSGP